MGKCKYKNICITTRSKKSNRLEDTILREYLVSTASQYSCRGGSNGDDPTNPTLADFAALGSALSTSNALKFLTGKLGEDRFGSAPIRSAYFVLAHTLLERTFDLLDGYTNVWDYPNQQDCLDSEHGAILNFRVLTSSNSSVNLTASQNGASVFNNIVTGKQGYAHIAQDGYSMRLLYRDPIFSGPLALNGTLGVKFAQAQIIEQETWVKNFRCTAAL